MKGLKKIDNYFNKINHLKNSAKKNLKPLTQNKLNNGYIKNVSFYTRNRNFLIKIGLHKLGAFII